MIISLDLVETLFVNSVEVLIEPDLKFPYNKLYKNKLRKGAFELLKEINSSDTEWADNLRRGLKGFVSYSKQNEYKNVEYLI